MEVTVVWYWLRVENFSRYLRMLSPLLFYLRGEKGSCNLKNHKDLCIIAIMCLIHYYSFLPVSAFFFKSTNSSHVYTLQNWFFKIQEFPQLECQRWHLFLSQLYKFHKYLSAKLVSFIWGFVKILSNFSVQEITQKKKKGNFFLHGKSFNQRNVHSHMGYQLQVKTIIKKYTHLKVSSISIFRSSLVIRFPAVHPSTNPDAQIKLL